MGRRAEEAFAEREEKMNADGDIYEIEVKYLVFECENEELALATARTAAESPPVPKMVLDRVEMSERLNADTWRVKAVYVPEEEEADEDDGCGAFAFDTGGGTMHLNQSLETVSKAPKDAADFNGAIGVDNEGNVAGVDITVPVLNFTETHVVKESKVTTAYKKTVAALTGTVNRSSFRGFERGEVLFLGASGTKTDREDEESPWEIVFRFAVSPNQQSVRVGSLSVSNKRGWDYLWVRYSDKVAPNGKNVVKEPVAAYVERVYQEEDFGRLGIGK